MNTIKTNTNTALFTLDLVAQCEANLILDMFGSKMSKKSREKAFKTEADALYGFYLDALAA